MTPLLFMLKVVNKKNQWDSPTFSHKKLSSAHLSIKLHAGQAQNMERKVPPLQKRGKKEQKGGKTKEKKCLIN